jgi:hypothetical protein
MQVRLTRASVALFQLYRCGDMRAEASLAAATRVRKFRFCIVSPANRKFTRPDPKAGSVACLGVPLTSETQKGFRPFSR